MKTSKHLRYTVLAVIVAGMTACGTARRGPPLEEPVPADSSSLVNGMQVFMQNCHRCHPGGEAGLAPALNNKPLPGFLVRLQVRKGLGAMPAFSEEQISEGQLDDLIVYTAALQGAVSTGYK